MDTELKSIRFPKVVVKKLDQYSKEKFGMPFSKFMIHLAVKKVEDIKREEIQVDIPLINSYFEAIEQLRSGKVKTLKTHQEIDDKLDEWENDEK